jgi:hypothetical protein
MKPFAIMSIADGMISMTNGSNVGATCLLLGCDNIEFAEMELLKAAYTGMENPVLFESVTRTERIERVNGEIVVSLADV